MRTAGVISLLVVVILAGCTTQPDHPVVHRTPTTYFWIFPDTTLKEGNSKQRIRWWGDAPDGVVKGYLFASGKFLNTAHALPSPDTIGWRWTTRMDTLVAFPLVTKRDTFDIAIRAVDNDFQNTPTEGALIRLTPTPYWDVNEDGQFDAGDLRLPTLSGAYDPVGATQPMPVLNRPPSLTFAFTPNDPSSTMQQPDTTYTAATFSWIGTDPDGDQTIQWYKIALNDTSTPDRWFFVPGTVSLISIVVPRSRSDTATGEVAADIYSGTFLKTGRRIGMISGLRLNALNTFFIRTLDIAGDSSATLRMPDTNKKWFVKKPQGKLLIVDDFITNVAGRADSTLAFYKATFGQKIGGGFAQFDVIDIGRGLGAAQKASGTFGNMVPAFTDPAFIFTLQLYDVVFWYSDQFPSLTVAQFPLYEYTHNTGSITMRKTPGKVIFTTMFQTSMDPRGALKDFAPIDSVSSVDLISVPRLLPSIGDTRILQGTVIESDSTDYPVLRCNTDPLHPSRSFSLYMRPMYKHSGSRYLYHMAYDTQKPQRYVYLATLNELRSCAAVGAVGVACGLNGTVLSTADSGHTWTAEASETPYNLQCAQMFDGSKGWIVGDHGTILSTTDGGADWTNISVPSKRNLEGVHFINPQFGTIVGTHGLLIQTSDGGSNWYSPGSGQTNDLFGVRFSSAKYGIAVGDTGVILRTTDSGATWHRMPNRLTDRLRGISFIDPGTVWVTGSGSASLVSTDSGKSWTQRPMAVPDLRSITFSGPGNGWTCGASGAVYHTTNGGALWTASASGVSQDLNAIATTGPSTAWTVGTGGIILYTSTGGGSWTPQPEGQLNVGVIDGTRRFVFLSLPLHLLNGDGTTVQPFLEHVLYQEFGF